MHEDVFGEGFGFDGAPKWACDASAYAAFVPKTPWFLSATDPLVEGCVDAFYTTPERRQHFVDAWAHVAARLAASPAVIGFDILNEPNWGTYPLFQFERDRLVPLYADVVTAVRAQAPAWIAFAEPSAARNGGIPTSITSLPFPDAMYAPHAYDQGAESGSAYDPANRGATLANGSALAAEAQTMSAGLWIGEYGGVDTDPTIGAYMTDEYDAAAQSAGSTMYWSYDKSDGYGLLDPQGNEKADLLDVVVRPYPELVAGQPLAYGFDAATSTLTVTYVPDRALAAPTDLVVPARVYPAGYTVECGGCGYTEAAGELHITTPPPAPGTGSAVTITVHP
jgi:endoglycosylceramidase